MRAHRLVVFGVLLVASAAHAAFREAPPSSLRLLETGGAVSVARVRASVLAAQPKEPPAASPQDDGFSAPPLLSAPGGEAQPQPSKPKGPPPLIQQEQPGPRQSPDTLDIPVDPYAGTFVGKEVALGAAAVFAVDVATVLVVVGVGVASFASVDAGSATIITLLAAAIAGLVNLVATPLAAAIGAYSAAPKEGNNGLFGAILGAYAAQAVSVVIYLGASFGVGLLSAAFSGAASPVATVFSVALGLVFLGLHWVGLPLASSFGIHWGGAVNERERSLLSRRREQARPMPTRPHELLDEAMRPKASPIFTVTF